MKGKQTKHGFPAVVALAAEGGMGVEPDVDFGVVFVAPRAFFHDLGLFYGFEAVAVGGFEIGLGIIFWFSERGMVGGR